MKIMVGYIDTSQGQAALQRAVAETRLRDGHLIVVHSMRGDEDGPAFIAVREGLEKLKRELVAADVDHEIRQLARGLPAGEDLAALANEEDVELIVIGIRRRSPVAKLVLGSNAQDVFLQANCAVLAVKAADDVA